MRGLSRGLSSIAGLALMMTSLCTMAQFTGSVQGDVRDASGAAVNGATVILTNADTRVSQSTNTNSEGIYHFLSLAPGNYEIAASEAGFVTAKSDFVLRTDENRNVALVLTVEKVLTNVVVTSKAPLLDTSDSRNQLTIDTLALQTLPLYSLNPTALIALTPGVTGLGAGTATTFFTAAPDYSANGRGSNANQYIIDGLDINLDVNAGTLVLVPSSDALSEMTVQTNTYAVDYGRVSSTQTVMTTKSGTAEFHGFGAEYYTYQGFNARGEFGTPQPTPVVPFHTNNMSFGIGGPIIPKHQFFFFFSIEPYLSSTSTGNQVQIIEDPAFVSFAESVQPNTPETALLQKYPPSQAIPTGVASTALDLFGPQNLAANSGCATPSTDNIPCATPVYDSANFNSAQPNLSKQLNLRIDKYFSKDRIYGTWFRSTQDLSYPTFRPAFNFTIQSSNYALQGNETHTFSPNMLNEASFGYSYLEETEPATGLFSVPVVNVSGLGENDFGSAFGDDFALGKFAEDNYHWRDVLTRIQGTHVFKFGYEGWHGTDIADFAAAYGQPYFQFNSMIDFINNNPYFETDLSYNPVTGNPDPANYEYAMTTGGVFAEDTWKATRRVTVNYGIRYDNFGNAYPVNDTNLANFHLGSGSSFADQVAAGVMTVQSHVLPHDLNWIFSPRVGVAWDPTGSARWVVRGGVGLYHDWITLGNQENGLSSNPPGFVVPTFYNNGSTSAPIFANGTQNVYPFGFPYPKFGGQPLNPKGGLPGGQFGVGGVDSNIKAPLTTVWSATVERQLTPNLVASAGYVGQHSSNLLVNSGVPGNNTYGTDVNVFAGDLVQHPGCTPTAGQTVVCNGIQTRLNDSFGAISYNYNAPWSNYAGLILALRGRFTQRGFVTASYTRSVSKDNAGSDNLGYGNQYSGYPSEYDFSRWYGPSTMDVPNRFSFGANYALRDFYGAKGVVGRIASGWQLSGIVVLQSGYPFTVITTAPFAAQSVDGGPLTFLPSSGDFNADGDDIDFPNVSSYKISKSRKSYINGLFPHCSGTNLDGCGPFTLPEMGEEGNEEINQFRNPGFAQTDLSLKKVTDITERVRLELRFDLFNAFNRVNLSAADPNANDGPTFGTSTSTQLPRQGQIAARITF